MDSPEVTFTLAYLVFAVCFVFTPNEFHSAGLTVQNLLSGWLGSEDAAFVSYHLRRTAATLLCHSLLPLGEPPARGRGALRDPGAARRGGRPPHLGLAPQPVSTGGKGGRRSRARVRNRLGGWGAGSGDSGCRRGGRLGKVPWKVGVGRAGADGPFEDGGRIDAELC